MMSIAKWLRSVGETAHSTAMSPVAGPSETPQPSLFHCQSCGTVYIATEKQTCSTCNTDVEQVPSTFAEV